MIACCYGAAAQQLTNSSQQRNSSTLFHATSLLGSLHRTQLGARAHTHTHTHTHTQNLPVGTLKTSGQPVPAAATYTTQHNTQTPETNIPAVSGIRTRVPSNGAPADLRVRPHGHGDCLCDSLLQSLSSYRQ